MNYSPIALFVYKRPEHTRRTIESLMRCPEFADSPLYVFCDGAKTEQDKDKVMQTRQLVHYMVGKKSTIVESPTNKGLADSIILGVTHLCDIYGRVIVVEDDLVLSPVFLSFLNHALEKYQDEPSVMQISGYMYPIPEFTNRTTSLFLPFTTSWGWGTWKRAWECFDPEINGWEILETDLQMQHKFNLDGTYNYFNMLKMQIADQIDSWAIRWYWSIFKINGYALFPPISYVSNVGLDGSGTHGFLVARWFLKTKPNLKSSEVNSFPDIITVRDYDYKLIKKFLRTMNNKFINILKKLKNIFLASKQ
ncbi:MAG: hypothetical protein KME55_19190 [Nostoc indistinguendum CM1-VF10]|jgi:hypothetical protein|nr:hypothetical protein [Nostoc indistinguendum CM1-VF10]